MDAEKKKILISAGADVSGAMERFMDNEDLYWNFLKKFSVNPNFKELETAIQNKDWEQSLTISHNLKGVSGGLGFTHLYDLLSSQVQKLRQNDFTGAAGMMDEILGEYHTILAIVKEILES